MSITLVKVLSALGGVAMLAGQILNMVTGKRLADIQIEEAVKKVLAKENK